MPLKTMPNFAFMTMAPIAHRTGQTLPRSGEIYKLPGGSVNSEVEN
jgi:hypothetical protein